MKTSWNQRRAERASSSPACCRERSGYPPGYTVFECRLDGNQPIAQVVQVPPPDSRDNASRNETCMILETKQSEFGPCARVAAYPGPRGQRTASNRAEACGGMSFVLEARDQPGGATACAGKVAKSVEPSIGHPLTILETTKGPACRDGPSSRLTYGPLADSMVRTSAKSHEPSALYIECTTGPKGPVARVTQVPKECAMRSSAGAGTRYETFVKHDGTCPVATVTQSNEMGVSGVERACEYLETRVCSSGPRATVRTLPERASNVRHFTHLNVRARENGPTARITQQPGDQQCTDLNEQYSREKTKPPPVCGCHPGAAAPARHQRKFATTCGSRRAIHGVKSAAERRNGLSPTRLELEGRVGPFKYSRVRQGRIDPIPKCCRPPMPDEASPHCTVQPDTCTEKVLQSPRLKSPPVRPTSCLCPLQSFCNSPNRLPTQMHPLPGGSVFSQFSGPSLPDIAPVPLGPNRLRDYKPRPKPMRPRKANAPTRRRPAPSDRPGKLAKSPEQEPKKTKNKKTGSRRKSNTSSASSREDENQELPRIPSEKYVECPTFASQGNQSDPVQQEPVYVQCPAEEKKSEQSCICEEPSYVECPAYQSKRESTIPRIDVPSYVRCPAYELKESSETDCGPRENELIGKYPEHFRAKTVETFLACRAKRNGLQDECRLHIPESVLRMSYEQRRNRHARTLVSCCTKRRRSVDDEAPRTEFREQSAKKNHRLDPQRELPRSPSYADDEEEADHSEEHGSKEKKKTKHSLKAVKSRELRAGVVYYDCDCYHRNGLQQDCPRGGCGGLKHCVSKPWPRCNLSRHFTHKWGKYEDLLDLIPPASFCGPRDALYKAKLGKYDDDHKTGEDAEKTDEYSYLRCKTNGKSGNRKDEASCLDEHRFKQKHGDTGSEKCCGTNRNMVQHYAIIPIANNNYNCPK